MPEAPAEMPPYCPEPHCISHRIPGIWSFKKKGFFRRQHAPFSVQRYVCKQCGRNFSTQTYSVTYWLREPELLGTLFWRVLACSAYRQIAHELKVSHTTVQRQVEKLGRHCLLLHEKLRPAGPPREALVLDGLRSFEASQYWPFDLNVLVGSSHFIYGFNDAELRRSGSMKPGQRRKRSRLEQRFGKPAPQATRSAVEELLGRIVPLGASARLDCDQHRAYPQALRRLRDRRIELRQTSSREARTLANPLFPANLADLLLRHTGANHKRETIAFSKRRQSALYRAAIWTVWRNYVKSSSERLRSPPPGVRLGVIPERLRIEEILVRRLFVWRVPLGDWLTRCYYARIPTRCLPEGREHRRRYAI